MSEASTGTTPETSVLIYRGFIDALNRLDLEAARHRVGVVGLGAILWRLPADSVGSLETEETTH